MLFDIYVIGGIMYFMIHFICGNCFKFAVARYHGRYLFRFPAIFAIIPMTVLWPVVLPMQLYQGSSS